MESLIEHDKARKNSASHLSFELYSAKLDDKPEVLKRSQSADSKPKKRLRKIHSNTPNDKYLSIKSAC